MNILVSGVAGDIGFGVGRILKFCAWNKVLYGIDIHDQHAGLHVFDYCATAPHASNICYIKWLEDYIVKNNIDIFIPISESEIGLINEIKIDKIEKAKIIIPNSVAIENSLDKFQCLKFLYERGIMVPVNGLVGSTRPDKYPVIVKPRSGQGSKGIIRIDNLDAYSSIESGSKVWQEFLTPEDEEYTCPVYRSSAAGLRILIIKRKLQGGVTGSGEIVNIDEIYKYVESIAVALELDGVMNVQLRLTASGPLLFEINPRLSSTLVFRDKLGFCDLQWWLADKLGMPIPSYQPPNAGTRFFRGSQEYIF